MMTPAWQGLAFICSEDPSALNKVRLRPVLLEVPNMEPGSLSLGFLRPIENTNHDIISLQSDCVYGHWPVLAAFLFWGN